MNLESIDANIEDLPKIGSVFFPGFLHTNGKELQWCFVEEKLVVLEFDGSNAIELSKGIDREAV